MPSKAFKFSLLRCLFLAGILIGIAHTFAFAQQKEPSDKLPRSDWTLSFVPSPGTGASIPTLLQIADTDHSDVGFVGMMVRCDVASNRKKFTPILIIVDPLAPRAKPEITMDSGSGPTLNLEGHVIPTGAGVSLNLDLREKIAGAWRDASALTVKIRNMDAMVAGVIQLRGLSEGLDKLAAACSQLN